MVKPTPPTAPEAPLRSDPAFSTKAQTFLTWLAGGFNTYVGDAVDFVDERADEALAAATTFGFPSIAGKALNFTRVNSGATALEFRTAAQVRSDIGATVTGSSVFTAADSAAGRSALSAMAQPTYSAGLGQIAVVYAPQTTIFSAPAGGKWWGRYTRRNNSTLGIIAQNAAIYTGGTNILTLGAGEDCFGDFIRIE
jgi:hypothetical protein